MTHIRPATGSDLPAIRALALHIWPVAYADILSPQQLDYMLDRFYSLASLAEQHNGHRFLMLESAGIPQGFASFGPLDTAGAWKLHKLYVLPELHGKGFGKALLHEIEGLLGEENARSLRLNVNRFNPALRFYHRMGFHTIREEDIDIGGGYFMNDYVLEKTLGKE